MQLPESALLCQPLLAPCVCLWPAGQPTSASVSKQTGKDTRITAEPVAASGSVLRPTHPYEN